MLKSKLLSHNIYMFYLRYVFSRYYNCQSQGCVDVLGLQQHNISTKYGQRGPECVVWRLLCPGEGGGGGREDGGRRDRFYGV